MASIKCSRIRISSARVVTDLIGNSGRQMLVALSAGECDPKRLSSLALGRLRRQPSQVELVLAGQCMIHHGHLIQGAFLMDLWEQQITDLDQYIGALVALLQPHLALAEQAEPSVPFALRRGPLQWRAIAHTQGRVPVWLALHTPPPPRR